MYPFITDIVIARFNRLVHQLSGVIDHIQAENDMDRRIVMGYFIILYFSIIVLAVLTIILIYYIYLDVAVDLFEGRYY